MNKMTSAVLVLCLTCWFLGKVAQTTNVDFSSSAHQESSFISAKIGDSVTMQCFLKGAVITRLYWYKQTLGQIPRLMSTYYKYKSNVTFHDEFKDNPRFSLDTTNENNHLKITDLQVSDSATYLCAFSYSYVFEYSERITVRVEGSESNVQTLVHQSTLTVNKGIHPGSSATLYCTVYTGTCDGEHSVYWFRDSGEPHPGLIYTHGDSNDQCENKVDTQTHCVYQLPMNGLNRSHAGMYYCAVASCGHILFGDRTTLDIKDDEDSLILYFLSGALTFTTTLIVLMAFSVCKMKKKYSESLAQRPASSLLNAEVYRAEDNIPHAALKEDKTEGAERRKSADTWSECVYFQVKQ